MNGSASAFRKSPWSAAPLAASTAPVASPARTRGSRWPTRIARSVEPASPSACPRSMGTAPKPSAASATAAQASARIPSAVHSRRGVSSGWLTARSRAARAAPPAWAAALATSPDSRVIAAASPGPCVASAPSGHTKTWRRPTAGSLGAAACQ
jgi:hypothetical protein